MTAINNVDINELNNKLIKSLEADHLDVDLDALFYRSFCYSFCDTEEYTLPWPTALAESLNEFKIDNDVLEFPRKRKPEGIDQEDDSFYRRRTRTSNSGLLPSFNCFSNVDIRARRVFQAYRNDHIHVTRLHNRDRKFSTRARWQSEPVDVKAGGYNEHTIFSPCITLPKSAEAQDPSDIPVPKIEQYHDTMKSIPNSPSKVALTPRNMNLELLASHTQPSLSSTLHSLLLNETEHHKSGTSFSPTPPNFGLSLGPLSDSRCTTFEDYLMPTQPSTTTKASLISNPLATPTLKKRPRRRRARTIKTLSRFISTFPVEPEVTIESYSSASSLRNLHHSNREDSRSDDEEDLTPSSSLAGGLQLEPSPER